MKKKQKYNEALFEAIHLLAEEKGIDEEYLLSKIKTAIALAVKRDYDGCEENVEIVMDSETKEFTVTIIKKIVEYVEDPATEISLEDALAISKRNKLGGNARIELNPQDFGRVAAQTAKHVIRQGIREAERGQTITEFQRRTQDMASATVVRVDPISGNAVIQLNTATKAEAILPRSEQIPDEILREGMIIRVYVADVRESERGTRIVISRTHPGLVKRLFEEEVPEIRDGTVEIKAISREAGSRTKMAVLTHDENVDAIGSCIGPRHSRVDRIAEELGNEKIDIVEYSEDPAAFIVAALSPAKVVDVEVDPDGAKSCHVRVPEAQLSLAIGNKGQNARLAAKLTGWKIDIRPESGFYGEEADEAEE